MDHSANLCELDAEWDIDAQEYTSCYGRFANDNFQDKTINCRLYTYTVPGTQERKLLLLALPGDCIVPGEELYSSYGRDYWLDHLPMLSATDRLACIRKYHYPPSVLHKAGLLRDGSRTTDSTQGIGKFFKPERSLLIPTRLLHDQTIIAHETFSLYFSSLTAASIPYRDSDSYARKRAA